MKLSKILSLLFSKRLRLDRGVSVRRGPSHTCGKTGASFPWLVKDAHLSPLNNT